MFALVKLFSPSSTLSVYNEGAAGADLDFYRFLSMCHNELVGGWWDFLLKIDTRHPPSPLYQALEILTSIFFVITCTLDNFPLFP